MTVEAGQKGDGESGGNFANNRAPRRASSMRPPFPARTALGS
ncbi:hypothetical protein [Streptomyces reniochalinae]|nr:hypothetical protein [Streptomyces reniochalinae]